MKEFNFKTMIHDMLSLKTGQGLQNHESRHVESEYLYTNKQLESI